MSLESNTDMSAADLSSYASYEHELLGVDHDQTPQA
jgi:hypothetical protein